MTRMKKIIKTKNAPLPIGSYNQAVAYNGILYVSGQIPINPKTGELVSSTIEEEAEQVMCNLEAILKATNLTFENVIKTSIFIKDMRDFSKINAVYTKYFQEETAPARETIEVANLPKLVNVEISLIAGIL